MESNFLFTITADGSPTLRLKEGTSDSERWSQSMHSLEGAWAETLYIYGSAVTEVLVRGWPPHFLSIGLGLGYVEIVAVAATLAHLGHCRTLRLDSFEKEPSLRHNFAQWLLDPDQLRLENAPFFAVYQEILKRAANHFALDSHELFDALGEALRSQSLCLHEDFNESVAPGLAYSGILFDAFSSQSSPELWREELLRFTLQTFSDKQCVFSTYAATGTLKRVLKAMGFTLLRTQGFAGKRESTLAMRE